jgi:hypothetical protein
MRSTFEARPAWLDPSGQRMNNQPAIEAARYSY